MEVTKYHFGFNTIRTFTAQQKWRLLNLVEFSDVTQKKGIEDSENKMHQTSQTTSNLVHLTYPRIKFECFANRRPFYYYANGFCLIFLITIITFGTFGIKIKSPQFRLNTTATIFLTSVSFKWVVNRNLPETSYFTSLDAYSILSIFFIILVYSWHSLVGYFPNDLGSMDHLSLILFVCLFALIQIVFIIGGTYSYLKVIYYEQREKCFLNKLKRIQN